MAFKENIQPLSHRIIISGGGTGGHIFPAIAIAQALKKLEPSINILFIGAKGKMEMEKIPQEGFDIIGLDITGFNRQSLLKNLSFPFKLIKSFFQVKKIFSTFKPNAVIGVGGYASFPILYYAQFKGIKSFIHESNSFAGKANIVLGKKATRIFVGSAGMEKFFPSEKIMITGNPVRNNITASSITREEAIKYFQLNPQLTTILAVGGSLGAKSINLAIANGLNILEENQLQLIWQTGKATAKEFIKQVNGRKQIWVNDFILDMATAYAAADIVISRAGAMSVTELCVAGKPSIFVPFPLAAEDHQTFNARYLVNANAALLVKDNEAHEKLIPTVIQLSKNKELLTSLHNNRRAMAIKDADVTIANEILNIINE